MPKTNSIRSKNKLNMPVLLAVMGVLAAIGVIYVLSTRASGPVKVYTYGSPGITHDDGADPNELTQPQNLPAGNGSGRDANYFCRKNVPSGHDFGKNFGCAEYDEQAGQVVWVSGHYQNGKLQGGPNVGEIFAWRGPSSTEAIRYGEFNYARFCADIKAGSGTALVQLVATGINTTTRQRLEHRSDPIVVGAGGFGEYCSHPHPNGFILDNGIYQNLNWNVRVINGQVRISKVSVLLQGAFYTR